MMASFILAVLLAFAVCFYSPLVESCSLEEADLCGATVFLYSLPNFTIPGDQAALDQLCKSLADNLKCLDDFKENCMKPLTKQLGGLLIKGAKKLLMEDFCGAQANKQRVFTLASCLNGQGTAFHKCMKQFVADMEVSSRTHPDDAVPYACCYFNEFEDCVLKVAEPCGPDAPPFVDEIVRGQSQDLLGQVCATYREDKSRCNEFEVLDRTAPPTYYSILPSLVQVIDTLSG